MTGLAAPAERAVFYDDSSTLSQEGVKTKFAAWELGMPIQSRIDAVGLIMPTLEEVVSLDAAKLRRESYDSVEEHSPLLAPLRGLREAFMSLVMRDVERCDLDGKVRTTTFIGYYEDIRHREPWHVDNYNHPSVRWTVAFGVGSTAGAVGQVSKKDILCTGDLKSEIPVESGSRLEPAYFDEGTVLRFQNVADMHAGPCGSGVRLMIQSTLSLRS